MDKVNISIYKQNRIRITANDKAYYMSINLILGLIGLLVLYPLIFVLSASFSSPAAVSAGKVFLWPVDLSFEGYAAVFKNKDIISGYINTFIYTGFGTVINLAMTIVLPPCLS
jgi:putative aldouronate transport system permease protein